MFWKRGRYNELERALGELKESVLSIAEERDEWKAQANEWRDAHRETGKAYWDLLDKCEECERELEQAKDKYQTLLDSLPQPDVKGVWLQVRRGDLITEVKYEAPLRVEVIDKDDTSTLILYDASGKQIGAVHQVLQWEYIFEEGE